jgi:hypothetical protein
MRSLVRVQEFVEQTSEGRSFLSRDGAVRTPFTSFMAVRAA